jgi:S1-C subfamily serine protease
MTMHRVTLWGSVMVCGVLLGLPPVEAGVKTGSLVKVFVNMNSMDYVNPWQSHGGQMVTGSGCIIGGNRILTNAHVVDDQTFIQVRKESDPKKYTATVEALGQDYDLALLRVEDPEFFRGVSPLEFGGLPNLQDAVTVFGYPIGGEQLSITTGVVSRIEVIPYTQSERELLSIQIDAAINPGNSGGPVLKDGHIVGVAMQGISPSQNIGYMIPAPVIAHFLDEVARGASEGVPTLGVLTHNTENESLRRYYGMPETEGGVVVTHVAPFSSADGLLQEGDVILALDGVPVSADGTVPFRENERLDMSYVISAKHVGEMLTVKYRRGGASRTLPIGLKRFPDLVPPANASAKPSYYIYGGLGFTVLSTDLMNEWRDVPGFDSESLIPLSFKYWAYGPGALNTQRKKELVVLSEVLPDPVNVGYHGHQFELITKVNGQAFDSFKEFVLLVERNEAEYVVFENEGKQQLVLAAKEAARATEDIIKRNHIPSRCSEDVSLWLKE